MDSFEYCFYLVRWDVEGRIILKPFVPMSGVVSTDFATLGAAGWEIAHIVDKVAQTVFSLAVFKRKLPPGDGDAKPRKKSGQSDA